MPPPPAPSRLQATSPPLDPTQHSAYLTALRPIDRISVPDLASTLTTPADNADPTEPGLSYIRTPIESRNTTRQLRTTAEILEAHRERVTRLTDTWRNSMEDRGARLDRLERVLAQLNRTYATTDGSRSDQHRHSSSSPPWRTSAEADAMSTHNSNRHAEFQRMQREYVDRQVEELRIQRDQREVMRMLASNADNMHQMTDSERALRLGTSMADPSTHLDRSTRQESRRHPRYWTRHRELLTRSAEYGEGTPNVDHGMQTDQRSERLPERSNAPNPEGYGIPSTRSRFRRSAAQPSTDMSSSSVALLQDTLIYLSNLRTSQSVEDSLGFARKAGLTGKDFNNPGFVYDLHLIPAPVPTSLLAPGATFFGFQFANSTPPEYPDTSTEPPSQHLLQYLHNEHSLSTSPDLRFRNRAPAHSSPFFQGSGATPSTDNWPVNVTIYDVDFETMTLSASMEAYDVPANSHSSLMNSPTTPQHISGSHQKPITTYLEGEILDLQTHTFVTENFTSTVMSDLKYWRKLPPFKTYSPAELPARLLNREFLSEVNAQYVLMRWKERCFVNHSSILRSRHTTGATIRPGSTRPEDMLDGCGLTISGFYYISMRRSDGLIEGLYCDPQSNPYQYLSLKRVKTGAFPSWSFR